MQVRCSVLLSCFCTNHRALQLERTAPAHHLCFFSPTPGYEADHGITGEVVTQPQGGPGRRPRSASRAALRHRRLQQPFPRGSAAGTRAWRTPPVLPAQARGLTVIDHPRGVMRPRSDSGYGKSALAEWQHTTSVFSPTRPNTQNIEVAWY